MCINCTIYERWHTFAGGLRMEGVPKTFWKRYKWKDLDFLLRSYTQLFFSTPRKNIFRGLETNLDFFRFFFQKKI